MRFEALSGQTPVTGRIAFIRHGGATYEFFGYTASSRWGQYQNVIDRSVQSFTRVSDSRILNIQSARMQIIEVPHTMTLQQFDEAYPSSVDLSQVAILNQLRPDSQLQRGDLVKRVVGGPTKR